LVVVAAPLALLLAFLPSPPSPVAFEVGSFALSYYGLFIALGIALGAWLTGHELERRGHDGALALEALLFVVPLGVVGARLNYVATEYDAQFAAHPTSIVQVWNGGLGIYGAVAGGFLGALLFAWVGGLSVLAFADAAAPGVALGQAVGRWGDYFIQKLFGEPSMLPWAIRISPENRPAEFADAQSFQPAFLYASIWDVLVCLLLLWIARRSGERLRVGDVFFALPHSLLSRVSRGRDPSGGSDVVRDLGLRRRRPLRCWCRGLGVRPAPVGKAPPLATRPLQQG
jgi:phosphatidylglycerol---prolipoprotein diacylglyceryl transferase